MLTIKDVFMLSRTFFEKKGSNNFRREAEEVLSIALDMTKLDLYLNFDKPLNEDEVLNCRQVLKRLAQSEPYAYIKGFVPFFGCLISVNSHVLIPRNETELLVEKIVNSLKGNESILDLCTGSGCIAISLKKKYPNVDVFAADISFDALEVAKNNAQKNNTSINFIQSDFLDAVDGCFDVIVCNPPYISENEYVLLEPSVLNFEPKLALVAEADGLYFYQKLAQLGKAHLNPEGRVWLEIGYNQGDLIKNIFKKEDWIDPIFFKDYSGNDRFFTAKVSNNVS
jgi:release factor glutamine methyltransferase